MAHIYDDSHPRQGSLRFLRPFQNGVPFHSDGLYFFLGFSIQYFQTTVRIAATEGSRATRWAYCVRWFSSRWVWSWDCVFIYSVGSAECFWKKLRSYYPNNANRRRHVSEYFAILWFYSCFSPMEINHHRVLERGRICKPAVEINDANWTEGSPVSRSGDYIVIPPGTAII